VFINWEKVVKNNNNIYCGIKRARRCQWKQADLLFTQTGGRGSRKFRTNKKVLMNKTDLENIFIAAFNVARADREVVELEREILALFLDAMGVDEMRGAELLDRNLSPQDAAGGLSSPEAQSFMVKTMCALAFSDGVRAQNEIDLIFSVNQSINQPIELRPWEEWEAYILEVMHTLREHKAA